MVKYVTVFLICVVLLSACAAGPNPHKGETEASASKPAGFWRGLWHGIIAPIAFIISWFKSSVGIYEVYNNGFWYNLGFVLGIMILPGGSGTAARRK